MLSYVMGRAIYEEGSKLMDAWEHEKATRIPGKTIEEQIRNACIQGYLKLLAQRQDGSYEDALERLASGEDILQGEGAPKWETSESIPVRYEREWDAWAVSHDLDAIFDSCGPWHPRFFLLTEQQLRNAPLCRNVIEQVRWARALRKVCERIPLRLRKDSPAPASAGIPQRLISDAGYRELVAAEPLDPAFPAARWLIYTALQRSEAGLSPREQLAVMEIDRTFRDDGYSGVNPRELRWFARECVRRGRPLHWADMWIPLSAIRRDLPVEALNNAGLYTWEIEHLHRVESTSARLFHFKEDKISRDLSAIHPAIGEEWLRPLADGMSDRELTQLYDDAEGKWARAWEALCEDPDGFTRRAENIDHRTHVPRDAPSIPRLALLPVPLLVAAEIPQDQIIAAAWLQRDQMWSFQEVAGRCVDTVLADPRGGNPQPCGATFVAPRAKAAETPTTALAGVGEESVAALPLDALAAAQEVLRAFAGRLVAEPSRLRATLGLASDTVLEGSTVALVRTKELLLEEGLVALREGGARVKLTEMEARIDFALAFSAGTGGGPDVTRLLTAAAALEQVLETEATPQRFALLALAHLGGGDVAEAMRVLDTGRRALGEEQLNAVLVLLGSRFQPAGVPLELVFRLQRVWIAHADQVGVEAIDPLPLRDDELTGDQEGDFAALLKDMRTGDQVLDDFSELLGACLGRVRGGQLLRSQELLLARRRRAAYRTQSPGSSASRRYWRLLEGDILVHATVVHDLLVWARADDGAIPDVEVYQIAVAEAQEHAQELLQTSPPDLDSLVPPPPAEGELADLYAGLWEAHCADPPPEYEATLEASFLVMALQEAVVLDVLFQCATRHVPVDAEALARSLLQLETGLGDAQ